jgi:hypothetical protein
MNMNTLIETTTGVRAAGLLRALKRKYRQLAPDLRDAVKQVLLEHASRMPAFRSAATEGHEAALHPPRTLGSGEHAASSAAFAASMASTTTSL